MRRVALATLALAATVIAASGCGSSLPPIDSRSSTSTSTTAATSTSTTTSSTTTRSKKPSPTLVASVARGRLPSALSGDAATELGGSVFVVGGLDAAGASSTTVTRIASGGAKVAAAGPLGTPLHDAAAATLGKYVVVFGGGATTEVDYVQALPGGGRAQLAGRLPSARSDSSAVSIGGKAFVVGGYDGSTALGAVLQTADGRTFQQLASLPVAVRYGAAVAVGRAIYVLGGERTDGSDTDAIQGVNTSNGKARVVAHLPQALSHASAIALGGRVFLLGGRVGGVSGSPTDRIVAFDPRTGRVQAAGHLPMPVDDGAAAVAGGTGYLAGGLGRSGGPLASIVVLRLR